MAGSRQFNWRSALAGALALLLLLIVAGATVIFGGLYPVAASKGYPPGVTWVLEKAMRNGVTSAADGLDPPPVTTAMVREGGSHFKAMCQRCHGGPGVKPHQFARYMDPDPPELTHAAEEWSRSEIFWIAKHGIKMTGMPAFGAYESDEELWKIASFVEQLPGITPAEYAALPAAGGHGTGAGHGTGGGDGGEASQSHSH